MANKYSKMSTEEIGAMLQQRSAILAGMDAPAKQPSRRGWEVLERKLKEYREFKEFHKKQE